MLYAAKCYWPGVDEGEVARVLSRAVAAHGPGSRPGVSYVGSLVFSGDDLVLCLFEGPSRAAVKRASEEAGIPCERVMDSVWLAPNEGAAAPRSPTSPRRQG